MKIKRKLFATIAMVLLAGAFTGCAKKEAAETLEPELSASIAEGSEDILESLAGYDEEYVNVMIEQYEDDGNTNMVNSLDTWLNTRDEVGTFVQIDGNQPTSVELKDKQYLVTVNAIFEKRPMEVTIIYDKKGMISNLEFAPVYTLGENMGRAAVHTLIGMGTVFIVLIFISLIIGCFKYINQWEKSRSAKAAPEASKAASAPAPAPAPAAVAPMEEEELVDDLERVAAIPAAIAASMNTSTDGLVVRSIRRKANAQWKRA